MIISLLNRSQSQQQILSEGRGLVLRAWVKSSARFVFAALTATLLTSGLTSTNAQAQSIDDPNEKPIELNDSVPPQSGPARSAQPNTGRKAAEKYMAPHSKPARDADRDHSFSTVDSHYLAVHLGLFVSDNAYKWGAVDSAPNIGRWNFGVTYRVGEWVNSMDLNVRIDVERFALMEGNATKISFLPLVTFPDASSKFPLFFGLGAGLGVFASQISNSSALSLDYQVIAGARFFNVFNNTGFFVEAGLKNHILLLSEGQFNGTFVSLGSVFAF